MPHTDKRHKDSTEEGIDNDVPIFWKGDQLYYNEGWDGNRPGTIVWCSFKVQQIKCAIFIEQHYFDGIADLFDEAFEQISSYDQKGEGKGKGKKGEKDDQYQQCQDQGNQDQSEGKGQGGESERSGAPAKRSASDQPSSCRWYLPSPSTQSAHLYPSGPWYFGFSLKPRLLPLVRSSLPVDIVQ